MDQRETSTWYVARIVRWPEVDLSALESGASPEDLMLPPKSTLVVPITSLLLLNKYS